MTSATPLALVVTIAVIMSAGCGPKRVAQPTRRLSPTLIVLLPDPDSGTTGRARVSSEFGSADLAAPRAAVRVTADGPPRSVSVSEADVKRLFGEALAALPPAPRHFTLHFRFESNALTGESTALVPEILRTVKGLSVPEVVIVGHTDTMGDPRTNVALGLKRAIGVRAILVEAGLAPSTIEVASHGEADLLVKTPDGSAEPRNRRVEITVR